MNGSFDHQRCCDSQVENCWTNAFYIQLDCKLCDNRRHIFFTSTKDSQSSLFADSLQLANLFVTPKSIWMAVSQAFVDMCMCRVAKVPNAHVAGWGGTICGSLVSVLVLINKCSVWSLLSAQFFALLCFFLNGFALQNDLEHSAKVLSSFPKHKKAVMCFMEKRYLLGLLWH